MRKTDISKFNDESVSSSVSLGFVTKEFFSFIGKIIVTALFAMLVTGIVIGVSILFYVIGVANEPLNINLDKMTLNQTSKVFVKNEDTDEFEEYLQLYATENRVWVSYKDIPKQMIDAQIAIEDKRFLEHEGVDWYRTGGAVFSLATGRSSFGGSTITQQLIKNITEDNEVSITRKLREIFRALKLEKEYSKDDIIETYLNVVNFGAGCRGVQSAANLYFNKDIRDCSIAECAAIAGITQNPYAYDPLVYPENNKERRETVIEAMFDQGKITMSEYVQAMEDSKNMKFIGYVVDSDDDTDDWSWYDDRVFRDVTEALQKEFNISLAAAEDKIYNEGLNIYSAVDVKAQEIAERKVREWETPDDPELDVGYVLMDFDGRVLATVGGREEHDGRLLWDNATQSVLQPGSTIKPLASYSIALDEKIINFSSLISDRPVSNWGHTDGFVTGPNNWYGQYYGDITVTRALNISSNAAAVSVLNSIGLETSYNFLTEKLNFQHLDPEQDRENLSGLSIGGFYGGATVEEMTAAYQIFCNGGYYYEPYTFYFVTDNEGNVILDNRDRGKPDQVISTETSTIMNRLLHDVVNAGGEALGYRVIINGWDIIGKTGTTDSSYDNWFLGASPYAVAGIWTGHEIASPIALSEQGNVHYLWRDIMAEWLKEKTPKSYQLGGNVEQHNYLISNGYLTSYEGGSKIATGYYTSDNMPPYSSVNPYYVPKSDTTKRNDDDDDDDDNRSYDDDDDDDDDSDYDDNDDDNDNDEPPADEPDEPDEPIDDGGNDVPDEPTDDGGGDEPDEPTDDGGGGEPDTPTDDGGGDSGDDTDAE